MKEGVSSPGHLETGLYKKVLKEMWNSIEDQHMRGFHNSGLTDTNAERSACDCTALRVGLSEVRQMTLMSAFNSNR